MALAPEFTAQLRWPSYLSMAVAPIVSVVRGPRTPAPPPPGLRSSPIPTAIRIAVGHGHGGTKTAGSRRSVADRDIPSLDFFQGFLHSSALSTAACLSIMGIIQLSSSQLAIIGSSALSIW